MTTAPGAAERKKLLAGGFSHEQVVQWESDRRARFAEGGFTNDQIDAYFGTGKPTTAAIRDYVDAEFTPVISADGAEEQPAVRDAKGFIDALAAGYQTSVGGLTQRAALPDVVLSQDADFVEVFGSAIGQFVGDIPVSVPSFFAGTPIGAAVGGSAGARTRSPIGVAAGTAVGSAIAGEAVSGFTTEATRQALMNFYEDNENLGIEADTRQFTSQVIAAIFDKSVAQAGFKGGATGVAAGATGGASRIILKPLVKNDALRQVTVSSLEATAAVSAAAALEGELPKARDFASAAALVLGLDASIATASRVPGTYRSAQRALQEHYVKTGEHPTAAAERARTDPVFRQQIAGDQKSDGQMVLKIEAGSERRIEPVSREEPIVIDTPKQAEGARKSMDLMRSTSHSAILGAARPETFDKPPARPEPGPEDVVAKARDGIRGKVKKTRRETTPRKTINDLRYLYVNDLQYAVSEAEVAFKDATGKRLKLEDNPGELMRLAYGAHARADLQIRKGIYSDKGQKISEGLDTILDGVKDVDHFVEYMIARRTLEKTDQGFDTGFDPIDADVVVKDADARTDFRDRFERVQKWRNFQIARMINAGYLTKKDAVKIIEQNRDFVPFNRVLDDKEAPPGATARGLPVRNPTKKFSGSDKDIFDPLEVMIKDRYAVEQLVENNLARRRMVEFNNTLPPEAQFIKKAKKQITVTKIAENDTQIKNFLEENGMSLDDATPLHIHRAVNKNLGSSDFIVFEDGKPVVYTADNPDLVLSMQRLDTRTQDAVSKMLSVPSAMLRAGVTLNPEFSIKASLRDQLGAMLQNKFAVVPFVDMFRGLGRLAPGKTTDPVVVAWIQNGGANSALLALDQQILNDAMSNRPRSIKERAWNVATLPARKAAAFSQMMENAMRLGRFERALDEGLDMQTAALQSRDVTLDFARMGARVRAYNMVTTWIGAGINGIDRFQVAWTRDPKGTMLKTAALITLPSLVLHFANSGEEWYENLPDWERMLFWHFPIGGTKDRPKHVVRIPMPHQFGTIFGYMPTKLMDEFGKAEPDAAGAIRESVMTAYNIPLFPTAMTPLAEIGFNRSFFTGRPLISESQQQILPEYQYTPYTTAVSRKLGKTLANMPGSIVPERFTSPIAIEHMVRGYGGTIGTLLLQELDTNLKRFGFLEDFTKPDPTMSDNPVYGAFFSRHPQSGQIVSDFYENAEDLDQVRNTLKQEVFRGSGPGADREIDNILRRRGAPALNPRSTRQALGKLRKLVYAIHFDDEIPADEKRQLIDGYTFQMIEIAREFNDQYEAFRRSEKEGE